MSDPETKDYEEYIGAYDRYLARNHSELTEGTTGGQGEEITEGESGKESISDEDLNVHRLRNSKTCLCAKNPSPPSSPSDTKPTRRSIPTSMATNDPLGPGRALTTQVVALTQASILALTKIKTYKVVLLPSHLPLNLPSMLEARSG